MIISHYSDTHGLFHKYAFHQPDPDAELIVHSGDFCANYRPQTPTLETPWQEDWIRTHKAHWNRVFGDKPVLLVPGNHDFCNVAAALREVGVDAHDLHDDWYEHEGRVFAGFKYVPLIGSNIRWMNETDDRSMEHLVQIFTDDWLRHPADVLVSHCPPHGIRDMANGWNLGSCHLSDFLVRMQAINKHPQWMLCGHIHESAGFAMHGRVTVSNAACANHRIDL